MNEDLMEINDLAKNAKGGTEMMQHALYSKVPRELLEKFQIIFSRVRDLDPKRIPLYYLHDLPGDPESEHLKGGGWNRFKKLIFVSNWQLQQYNAYYGVPYHKSVVLQNAIEPIGVGDKPSDKIKLIYHTTPHRGLGILLPVFFELAKLFPQLELDVFSSFEIYGWKERDKPYEEMFQMCRDHPQINYHGTQPNEVVREALKKAHIFAYPSIWRETSCISLMEAMSAKCICIHPNLAALPETAANFSIMYQWQEDARDHAQMFYSVLHSVIELMIKDPKDFEARLAFQKSYVDVMYSWGSRQLQWSSLLTSLLGEKGG